MANTFNIDDHVDTIALELGISKKTGKEFGLVCINLVNGLELRYIVFGAELFMLKQLAPKDAK